MGWGLRHVMRENATGARRALHRGFRIREHFDLRFRDEEGKDPRPEVMIPLVGNVNELRNQRDILEAEVKQVLTEQAISVHYKFGTMIEIPRAALTADEIAEYAEFFSFGTNDLTQTALGVSRDDAERSFLQKYVELKILPENPFQVLDRKGVGQLM